MTPAESRLTEVTGRIRAAESQAGREPDSVTLIAVSKTFDANAIEPVAAVGHSDFGENRVQEAGSKWPHLKARFPETVLHLIGPLQSNKAREAVALFDAIHSIDRDKIAGAVAKEMRAQDRNPALFIQVNTGEEPQKAGIAPAETDAFVERCRVHHGLQIDGLMCLPPIDENPALHFALLRSIAARNDLAGLSMGMSADYEIAIAHGATHVRVGSAIFGPRTP